MGERIVVHDLGCGTGSMGRWLAPRLAGPQHWIMYDRDADLLAHARPQMPPVAADGAAVTVETRQRDITRLDPANWPARPDHRIGPARHADRGRAGPDRRGLRRRRLPGAADHFGDRSGRAHAGRPARRAVEAAFNAHQRRRVDGRHLLGPDAVGAAVDAFARRGADVLVRPSPWRLGGQAAPLLAEWLTGWLDAACEQRPELTAAARAYPQRRRAEAAAGRLRVTVHHHDLLAIPR